VARELLPLDDTTSGAGSRDAATTTAASATTTAAQMSGETSVGRAYYRYALWLLLGIYTLNFLDRQIANILAEHIKRDLGLLDWQLGMLTGVAFSVFHATFGIPIARLADRRDRSLILTVSLTIWSAFTAACGLAQNFMQLLLARICVGAGEAGCTPTAYSLITEYAPREKRASALAFYNLGAPFGSLLGMAMGGLLVGHYGWRVAFIAAGAPGLVLALIAAFSLKEPRRALRDKPVASVDAQPSLREAIGELASKKTFWWVASAATIKVFTAAGIGAFCVPFLLRNHGPALSSVAADFGLLAPGFLGVSLGLTSVVLGTSGALLGGRIADKAGGKDVRAYAILPSMTALIGVPFYLWALLAEGPVLSICLFAIPQCLNAMTFGAVAAIAMGIVRARTRATTIAIQGLIGNLLGAALGPLCIGALSDVLASRLGLADGESLRWSMIAAALFSLSAVGLYYAASRTLRRDMVS
jgi:MFS family permease